MKTFGEKIKEARKLQKLTQKQLADLIGAAHNSVSDWENNKNKPDPDTIELLCGILKMTPNYLLASSEDVFSPKEKSIVQKYRFITEHSPNGAKMVDTIVDREYAIAEQLKAQAERIAALEQHAGRKRILAYYGRIAAAGQSYGFDDLAAGTITCENNDMSQNADFAIGVSGDSMEPTYYDGDIVFVKKATHLDIGDIGIFQKDNGIYIKEVGEDGLISHNKRYDPMINGGTVICLGKVLGKVDDHESMT